MEITAKMVNDLRARTGAGMMDCKSALVEANADIEEAVKILRKKDKVKADKAAGRAANQGQVYSYIHPGGKIGVLLELNCETDFAANSDEFKDLCKDVAMQIAAASPRFIGREEVTPEALEAEREIYRAQVAAMGKPAAVTEKIVEGKVQTWYAEACLLDQPFVKEPAISVRERIERSIGKIKENLRVRRFVCYRLGEDKALSATAVEAPARAS